MSPVRNPFHRPPKPLPIPPAYRTAPDATAQLCLCILGTLTHEAHRWVRLHARGALIARLCLYGLGGVSQDTWQTLARTGYVELHPLVHPRYIQLTAVGRAQARCPSPYAYITATPVQLAALRHLYPSSTPATLARSTPQEVALSWATIRTRFPLQWVVLEMMQAHIDGGFTLPDSLRVQGNFATYLEALTHLQGGTPSPTVFLAHTALTTLVLPSPPPPSCGSAKEATLMTDTKVRNTKRDRPSESATVKSS